MNKIVSEMRRRAAAYETAKAKVLGAATADDALYWSYFAATIAWLYPFDHWCDAEIDAVLEAVAADLDFASKTIETNRENLTHLISTTGDGGGHAEVLLFWSELFGTNIIATEWDDAHRLSQKQPIAPVLPLYRCPRRSRPAEKVRWIFDKLAQTRPAKVILNIDPNDAVALVACLAYRRASGAQLIGYDHADTFFWLGASLLDRVIEFRPVGATVAHFKRGISREKISLVPLTSRDRHSVDVTRASLNISPEATVSLTVAAYYKTKPDGHWDYAQTISRILEEHPNHHHLLVGHGSSADEAMLRERLLNERVHWLGKRTDVDALLRVSDFVIESFPLMGGTLRLDALRAGRPVVAISHPAWPGIFDTSAFWSNYPFVASSNDQVASFSKTLIADPSLRAATGARLKARFEEHFSHAAVARSLEEALAGKTFAEGLGEPPTYDSIGFTNLLNRGPLNTLLIQSMAKADLGYEPPQGAVARVNYLAGYTREALRRRIRQLKQRA
ncbi:MAG TPA: glycosyltransferase [Pyrinomonadaceae bacterium]|nr:glycosyltransferase [Pyrinomonadaceae bacterium]